MKATRILIHTSHPKDRTFLDVTKELEGLEGAIDIDFAYAITEVLTNGMSFKVGDRILDDQNYVIWRQGDEPVFRLDAHDYWRLVTVPDAMVPYLYGETARTLVRLNRHNELYKHNVHYLLDGERVLEMDKEDALALMQVLPVRSIEQALEELDDNEGQLDAIIIDVLPERLLVCGYPVQLIRNEKTATLRQEAYAFTDNPVIAYEIADIALEEDMSPAEVVAMYPATTFLVMTPADMESGLTSLDGETSFEYDGEMFYLPLHFIELWQDIPLAEELLGYITYRTSDGKWDEGTVAETIQGILRGDYYSGSGIPRLISHGQVREFFERHKSQITDLYKELASDWTLTSEELIAVANGYFEPIVYPVVDHVLSLMRASAEAEGIKAENLVYPKA